jgi:ABC-2 type transporter
MTSQPLMLSRFMLYYIVTLLLSFSAQGLGLLSGSLLNVKYTLILGSFFLCPPVLFSNFFVQMKDTHIIWHWMFELSFIKHALDGSIQAILGNDREKLECSAVFCPFELPQKFIDYLGIGASLQVSMLKLIVFAFVFRVIAFTSIHYRLKH